MSTNTLVATVLTVYGIETFLYASYTCLSQLYVATVLTVYGIETLTLRSYKSKFLELQQCLPFTVLKLIQSGFYDSELLESCNSAYRLRY